MECVPVYILAGGRSRRFGRDKARVELNGQPLVARQARLFTRRATRVSVVADTAGKFADLRLRTIADLHPGQGPLGGLHAALDDAAREFSSADEHSSAGGNVCYLDLPVADWLLLISCDTLGLDPDWLDLLLAERARTAAVHPEGASCSTQGTTSLPRVILFRGERLEPLFALYHVDLCDAVHRRLAAGRRALWQFIESVPHTPLPAPAGWRGVRNLNTEDDLAEWLDNA